MSDVKFLEAGGAIDIDALTPLERSVAITISFVADRGYWWNYVAAAQVVIRDVQKATA